MADTNKVLKLTIPGEPRPKGRPRFVRQTGRTYTPKSTTSYENLVRYAFTEAYPDWIPTEAPIELHLRFTFTPPQSWSKKKKEQALNKNIRKKSKPDLDNLEKAVMDALNHVAWADDSQIYVKYTSKEYSERAEAKIVIITHEE